MHARVTVIQMDPSQIDETAQQLRDRDIEMFKQLDGFKGFTLMADRQSGKVVGVSFYESEETLQASEDAVKDARDRAAETGGGSGVQSVDEFEVVIDTMA